MTGNQVKKGSKIKVEYTGTFDDGTVFDSSEKHGKPLEFTAGEGHVVKGFDDAVIGMKKGEEKDIKIEPKDGYGDPKPELVKKLPKEPMFKGKDVKPGMVIGLQTPDGKKLMAKVKEVSDKEVTIDLNHPLAGKTLNFKVKVAEIA